MPAMCACCPTSGLRDLSDAATQLGAGRISTCVPTNIDGCGRGGNPNLGGRIGSTRTFVPTDLCDSSPFPARSPMVRPFRLVCRSECHSERTVCERSEKGAKKVRARKGPKRTALRFRFASRPQSESPKPIGGGRRSRERPARAADRRERFLEHFLRRAPAPRGRPAAPPPPARTRDRGRPEPRGGKEIDTISTT
jgi:hypothetical protein